MNAQITVHRDYNLDHTARDSVYLITVAEDSADAA